MEKKYRSARTAYSIPLLILISLVLVLPFFHAGFPTTHDGYHHLVRTAHLAEAFKNGHLLPTWAGNLNQGFGSPVFLYNWLLLYYLAIPFILAQIPIVTSLKLILVMSAIASTVGFFLWARQHFDNQAALIASLVFFAAPYQFINLFTRGAFGETVGISLSPWVFYTTIKLLRSPSYRLILATTALLSLLLIAHHPTALLILPLLLLYSLIAAWKLHSTTALTGFFLATSLAFSLTAFFWLPAMVEIPYSHLPDSIRDVYTQLFMEPNRFGTPQRWSQQITQLFLIPETTIITPLRLLYLSGALGMAVGLPQTIAALLAAIVLLAKKMRSPKLKDQEAEFAAFFLAVFFMALFLVTPLSRFAWENVKLIAAQLYPQRYLTPAILSSAFLAGYALDNLKMKIANVSLLAILLITNINLAKPTHYINPTDRQLIQDQSSTDTPGGYVPRWVARSESVRTIKPKNPAFSLRNRANIYDVKKDHGSLSFQAWTQEPEAIVVNVYFFPGWIGYVNHHPTTLMPSAHGRIQLQVPKGHSMVELSFGNTSIRSLGRAISAITAILITVTGLSSRLRGKRLSFSTGVSRKRQADT